jgi:hypothetical protein
MRSALLFLLVVAQSDRSSSELAGDRAVGATALRTALLHRAGTVRI